ncbi:hypothetical protein [Polyangium fumosum]|uniref:Uncharacterized protein n=1 Tax=Polyangium fumosum TaxID=889272 RepID=A0A4U1I6L1_9BACT|nr:hypothetical protein [Polyangium fumosum]TKC89016.1 hypothetical protein E8A74_51445 [Polyangium fumosum]
MERRLKEYERLWTTDKEDYVLSGDESDIRAGVSCAIIDMRTNSILLIEDGELARTVKEKMLAAGVQVGDPHDINLRKEYIKRRLGVTRKR